MLERQKEHPVEKVGQELRKQMSWIKPEGAKAGR
jgi:ketol-acid reductoisomerase